MHELGTLTYPTVELFTILRSPLNRSSTVSGIHTPNQQATIKKEPNLPSSNHGAVEVCNALYATRVLSKFPDRVSHFLIRTKYYCLLEINLRMRTNRIIKGIHRILHHFIIHS